MAGIIEHGAGVAAGAQALAGGLQGMASGIMAGQELAAKKAELQQKRWMFRQAQEEEALREQQEQTQREWDALRAGLGPGTPESVDDVPPLQSTDTGETGVPGVRARPTGLTDDEARLFPSLHPDQRREILEDRNLERGLAHKEANINAFTKRGAMMESGQGLYEGASPEAIQLASQKVNELIEGYNAGLYEEGAVHESISKISTALADHAGKEKDDLMVRSVLYGVLERTRASIDPMAIDGGTGGQRALEWVERVFWQYENGLIDGDAAMAMVGIGEDGTSSIMAYAVNQLSNAGALGGPSLAGTMESENRLAVRGVPGRQPSPMGGGARLASAPGSGAQVAPRGTSVDSVDAQTQYKETPGVSPMFKEKGVSAREKARHADKLRSLAKFVEDGDGERVDRIIGEMTRNATERSLLEQAAAAVVAGDDVDDVLERLRYSMSQSNKARYGSSVDDGPDPVGDKVKDAELQKKLKTGGDTLAPFTPPGITAMPKGERAALDDKAKAKRAATKKAKKKKKRTLAPESDGKLKEFHPGEGLYQDLSGGGDPIPPRVPPKRRKKE